MKPQLLNAKKIKSNNSVSMQIFKSISSTSSQPNQPISQFTSYSSISTNNEVKKYRSHSIEMYSKRNLVSPTIHFCKENYKKNSKVNKLRENKCIEYNSIKKQYFANKLTESIAHVPKLNENKNYENKSIENKSSGNNLIENKSQNKLSTKDKNRNSQIIDK